MGRQGGQPIAPSLPVPHGFATLLYRARLHLASGSPQCAHEILEPVVAGAPSPPLPPDVRFALLSLLLHACQLLGHTSHLRERAAELECLQRLSDGSDAETWIIAATVLARVRAGEGDHGGAGEICRRVPPDLVDRCSQGTAATLYNTEATAWMRAGNPVAAERAVARYQECAGAAGDPELEGTGRALLAGLLAARWNLLEAQRLYSQAASLHRRSGDYGNLTRDLLHRASLLHRLGLLRESAKVFAEALRQASAIGLRGRALESSIGLGMVALQSGALPEARHRLLVCWREARRLGQRREEIRALGLLGEALLLLGRLGAARRALSLGGRLTRGAARDGEPVANRAAAPEGDLLVAHQLQSALLALFEDRPTDAESLALSAIEDAARLGLRWDEARGWRLLGTARARRNQSLGDRDRNSGDRDQNSGDGDQNSGTHDQTSGAREAFERSRCLFAEMKERLEIRLTAEWLLYIGERSAESLSGIPHAPAREPALHPAERARRSRARRAGWRPAAGALSTIQSPSAIRSPSTIRSPSANESSFPTAPSRMAPASCLRETAPAHAASAVQDAFWKELGLVTRSPRLRLVMEEVRARAALGDVILILGETGTGKDLLARAIHLLSERRGAFVPFNCAACPVELVESELFGAERGAFTGADRRRPGLAVEASGGTLFLDEIGDLPARAQGAVLRFVDQGEVRALGSTAIRRVELGLVTATHHPLLERVEAGAFRRDLYYRLAQGIVEVPPLRERGEDLDLLIAHLWNRLTRGAAAPGWLLHDNVLQTLAAHSWPGNVRELEQFLRTVRVRPDRRLRPEQIQMLLRGTAGVRRDCAPTSEDLRRALRMTGGNRRQAAALLGISRARLYRLLPAEKKGGGSPSGAD